jgi:nitrate/nitrite transport system permease protein
VVYLLINRAMPQQDPLLPKSMIIAAIVVGLCSLWPALVNTANGVANVDKDHLNVARVLRLPWWKRIWSIVLPSATPAIFTGVRVSLGVGWMVLIAAEMMAVSPGIGGFIWDWYQSSNDVALAYLVLSVIVIGVIGFLLDRMCITVQMLVSRGQTAAIR